MGRVLFARVRGKNVTLFLSGRRRLELCGCVAARHASAGGLTDRVVAVDDGAIWLLDSKDVSIWHEIGIAPGLGLDRGRLFSHLIESAGL